MLRCKVARASKPIQLLTSPLIQDFERRELMAKATSAAHVAEVMDAANRRMIAGLQAQCLSTFLISRG